MRLSATTLLLASIALALSTSVGCSDRGTAAKSEPDPEERAAREQSEGGRYASHPLPSTASPEPTGDALAMSLASIRSWGSLLHATSNRSTACAQIEGVRLTLQQTIDKEPTDGMSAKPTTRQPIEKLLAASIHLTQACEGRDVDRIDAAIRTMKDLTSEVERSLSPPADPG